MEDPTNAQQASGQQRQRRSRSKDPLERFTSKEISPGEIMKQSLLREFDKQKPRMLEILADLEETAELLDFMKKKVKVSNVVNSSVGVVGGLLSFVGLALVPATNAVSLALTVIGIGLVVANGVNTTITTATKKAVNTTQHKRAKENFEKFSGELKKLQDCLKVEEESTTSTDLENPNLLSQIEDVSRSITREATVNKKILDEIGAVSSKGTPTLSESDMSDLIWFNVLLVGINISSIYNNSIQLAEGCKSHEAELIRNQAKDWRSLLESVERKLNDLERVEWGAGDIA